MIGEMRGRPRGGNPGALAGYLRATWLARVSMTSRRGSGRVGVRGLAYAMFDRAPGTACLRLRLSVRGGRRTGRLTVLGGTGDGATLTGRAGFRWRVTRRGDVVLSGRIQSGTGPPRAPSRACAALRELAP